MESEADLLITTDRWKMTQSELLSLRAANARLVHQKGSLMDLLNRWQGALSAARGNVARAEKEIQEYIKNML